MNSEKPTYQKRTFYGPLELAPGFPQMGDRYILKHPNEPSKLIRQSGEEWSPSEMDACVYATQQVLKGLGSYGIHHVEPSFIENVSKDDQAYLLIVVTGLHDVQSYENLQNTHMTPDQVNEADQALTNMLNYTIHVIDEGGYIDPEMMRLEQFVYDPTQPPGKRMVLVDVEPLFSHKVDANEESVEDGLPSILAYGVIRLIVDAINLAHKAPYPTVSLQKAKVAVEKLPRDSPATNELKATLRQALDALEINPDILEI